MLQHFPQDKTSAERYLLRLVPLQTELPKSLASSFTLRKQLFELTLLVRQTQ
jgi:hypothetical protein